jgi:uncharacterized membrane protein
MLAFFIANVVIAFTYGISYTLVLIAMLIVILLLTSFFFKLTEKSKMQLDNEIKVMGTFI